MSAAAFNSCRGVDLESFRTVAVDHRFPRGNVLVIQSIVAAAQGHTQPRTTFSIPYL